MSNFKDPNFGMVGGDSKKTNAFENWLNNPVDLNNADFDLLNFIGTDEESNDDKVKYGSTEQEQKKHREDKLYATQQYNQLMFNDFQQQQQQQDNMHNGRFESFENQYHNNGVANFIGSNMNNGDRSVLSNSVGYGNMVDSSMIPTTSKSGMTMLIKSEPEYEHVENVGKLTFDDSGAYSDDADSYSHSIGSVGTYGDDGLFHPRTKPRKYRIKPEEEKKNPVYKIKREKNNDAVRRSRDKAKRIQIEKDERLAFLEQETQRKDRMMQQQRLQIENLQKQLNSFGRNCSCGAAIRI